MSEATEQKQLSVIRLPIVRARTGLGTSMIYAEMAAGRFPKPIRLSARTVGWLEAEVDEWLRSRVKERDFAKS